MKISWGRFNLYLLAAVALTAWGCHTEEGQRKKVVSLLRLHAEAKPDSSGHSEEITIHHDPTIKLTVDKEAFLTSTAVKQAKVVDVMGGFALRLQFDRQGTWLLEEYTAASRSRHIAIYGQFINPGEEKLNAGRWLAAPLISRIITNGEFTFTPDATRQEADQIALGLNNVARKLETGKEVKF